MPSPRGKDALLSQISPWYTFNQALASAKDVSSIFAHTMVFLADTLGAKNGLLGLLDRQRGVLLVVEASGPILQRSKGNNCKADEGACGEVIRLGSSAVIADALAEPLVRGKDEAGTHSPLSCICAPLRWGDIHLGILVTDNSHPSSEVRLTVLEAVASFISPPLVVARWGDETSLNEILRRKVERAIERMDLHTESQGSLMADVISLVERTLILGALQKANYVQLTAARFLGINRNTLRKKIKELGIPLLSRP
jgi:transcriptional regulator with GAF, ATPase, and Fis domain